MAPSVKLVYFSVQGKGEIVRLVLHAGKVGGGIGHANLYKCI
jgi:hypothetical protein